MKHPNINTVFVVDDDPIWRTLLVNMLKEIGYQNISAFESGPSCLYHLHKEPDLVFVDYSMSEMNGIELLQQIRILVPDTSVVLCTSVEDISLAVRAMRSGCADYITKTNTTKEELTNVINELGELRMLQEKIY